MIQFVTSAWQFICQCVFGTTGHCLYCDITSTLCLHVHGIQD